MITRPVYDPLTGFQRVEHCAFAFGRIRHLEDAKAQHGHFKTIVQFDCLHVVILVLGYVKILTQKDLLD